MKRRDFLTAATSSFFLPVMLDGYGAKAFSPTSPFMRALAEIAEATDRVLVVVQLSGGNDGINTTPPLDQMEIYLRNNFRPGVAIPENRILRLNGQNTVGLHPAMTAMQRMYNEGQLSIIQGVSYPQPNLSHFRANDIWFTASDSNRFETTGWLGRYLDDRFPRYPAAFPTSQMPDPLAIQIGAIPTTTLLGDTTSMAVVFQDPDAFARLVGDKPNVPDTALKPGYAGDRIKFIRQQQVTSVAYAGQIRTAAGKGRNQATYPTNNNLANQLRIVARLIHGGLQTKVFYVTIGGFDTHAAQTDANDPTIGAHANLLRNVSEGIAAFQNDLKMLGVDDKVVGMTFSEFGRTAVANGTRGTDHASAAVQFVFGKHLKGGMIGRSPNLSDLVNNNQLRMQFDFRQIYSTMLRDWFATPTSDANELLFKEFGTLPIFSDIVTGFDEPLFNTKNLRMYPNPTSATLVIENDALANSAGAVRIMDLTGREVLRQDLTTGQRKVQMDVQQLPAGNYIVQVQAGQKSFSGQVSVTH
jgi:uncharacterized protein (DUF1501 family)